MSAWTSKPFTLFFTVATGAMKLHRGILERGGAQFHRLVDFETRDIDLVDVRFHQSFERLAMVMNVVPLLTLAAAMTGTVSTVPSMGRDDLGLAQPVFFFGQEKVPASSRLGKPP